MPWDVFKRDDKWCVYKIDSDKKPTGKSLGCHDSKEKAEAQVKALYANESLASGFVYVDLASSLAAKQIDGLAAGEFTDMWGRVVVFKKDELPDYVKETRAALESTKSTSGELVGFPIDCLNHDHGLAAGWITDAELDKARSVVMLSVRWTELGVDQIRKDITRFFSPSVNVKSKVINGGSLTNYPASRTKEDQILLKPVELSQTMFAMSGEQSLDERLSTIRQAFYDAYGQGWNMETYPVEVFDGFLICRDGDKLFKVTYAEADDGITFQPKAEWVEVKQTYVEAAINTVRSWATRVLSGLLGKAETGDPQPGEGNNPTEEDMDFTKLTPEQRKAILAQLTSGGDTAELAALIDAKANERVTALLEAERQKAACLELAGKLAGGTTEAPRGIPVSKEDLAAFLQAPTPEKAKEILLAIQAKGLVDFEEHGHARKLAGKLDLPKEIKPLLQSWLASKKSLAEFFTVNPELGVMSDYNLAEFEPTEE